MPEAVGKGAFTVAIVAQGQAEFAERIARINSGAAASKQLLFVGVDEVYKMPLRVRVIKERGVVVLFRNAMYPISLFMAVGLGAVSQGLGQIARYHMTGAAAMIYNPDVEMLVQAIVGFAIAMVIGAFIGLRSNTFTPLKLAGSVLGVMFLHNAVHMFPAFFAMLASKLWVSQIVSHTTAHSVLWRGICFPF